MLCGLQVTCTYVCKIINRQCISFSHLPSLSVVPAVLISHCNLKDEGKTFYLSMLSSDLQ